MNKKLILTIVLLFLFRISYSQNFKKIFWDIDCKDKLFLITKPCSSLKVKKVAKQVSTLSNKLIKEKYLDADGAGGEVDAFRHIFLMYKISSEIGIKKARRIGNIYESYNERIFYQKPYSGYDEVGEEMDKFNNEVGIYLFLKLGIVDDKTLMKEIEKEIKKGTARKIKKDKEKRSISIDNKIIEDSIWKKSWKNERVLIQSNR